MRFDESEFLQQLRLAERLLVSVLRAQVVVRFVFVILYGEFFDDLLI